MPCLTVIISSIFIWQINLDLCGRNYRGSITKVLLFFRGCCNSDWFSQCVRCLNNLNVYADEKRMMIFLDSVCCRDLFWRGNECLLISKIDFVIGSHFDIRVKLFMLRVTHTLVTELQKNVLFVFILMFS